MILDDGFEGLQAREIPVAQDPTSGDSTENEANAADAPDDGLAVNDPDRTISEPTA